MLESTDGLSDDGSTVDTESQIAPGELVVVSNRQPYRHEYADGEGVSVDRPTGGLTAGLDGVMRRVQGTWIAWGDGDADRDAADGDGCVHVPPEEPDEQYTLERLWLDESQVENYYYGFSNRVLWPLCHGGLTKVRNCPGYWPTYRQVNDRFAAAIARRADGGTVVWLQDYHLALASRRVRQRSDDPPFLLQFWHIPWPDWDTARGCPHATELVRGLLGNDLLAFHTARYRDNFLGTVEAVLPRARVDWGAGRVTLDDHVTTVRAFPMGVPADDIRDRATDDSEVALAELSSAEAVRTASHVGVGVDRLDYTKGIPERLRALEHLFETRPRWRGSFTYVQVGTESRSKIPAYQHLQDEVAELVTRINDRFGMDGWQPVVYTTAHLSEEALCSLYRLADLALVTPIRDGMNLVAQEYVAAQVDTDGVLVLGEGAGAHDVFGDATVSVSPTDTEGLAAAIETALTMTPRDRRHRMERLRQHVGANDLETWMGQVFGEASVLRGTWSPRARV